MFRHDARGPQRLRVRQAGYMRDERVGLFVDVDILRVDTDGIFGLPPQRIH